MSKDIVDKFMLAVKSDLEVSKTMSWEDIGKFAVFITAKYWIAAVLLALFLLR